MDSVVSRIGVSALEALRKSATDALRRSKRFSPPQRIDRIAEGVKPFLSIGNQYGEGWFLCGEMVELLEEKVNNIVCIQPFACLPNHVMGKGVIKALRATYPEANIAAIDYDPGASEVNQLNRIKLMLAAAKRQARGSDAVLRQPGQMPGDDGGIQIVPVLAHIDHAAEQASQLLID